MFRPFAILCAAASFAAFVAVLLGPAVAVPAVPSALSPTAAATAPGDSAGWS
ncbi:hypothetical protein AB0K47_11310 [Streptomyces tirandamycinicus]|uniref:hypothetical protein n=1 Tax=Streptomyces tirandamycinicus TaxID=2174846 RepID=UPI0003A72E5E